MSDCEKCWNTPCTCGWDYKDWEPQTASEDLRYLILQPNCKLYTRWTKGSLLF